MSAGLIGNDTSITTVTGALVTVPSVTAYENVTDPEKDVTGVN